MVIPPSLVYCIESDGKIPSGYRTSVKSEWVPKKISYFSTKSYVKIYLKEKVLLSTQNTC